MSESIAELSEQQASMFARVSEARAGRPIAALASRDEDGRTRDVWWECDLTCLERREALHLRSQLAVGSYYSEVCDAIVARGFRRATDPGGYAAVDALLRVVEAVTQHVTQ